MREVMETFKVYKYETASSEIQEKIREWIITHWNLYDHYMEERVNTLKEFAELIGDKIDYSLSCVPDRGEYIKLVNYGFDYDLDGEIDKFINSDKNCELTGMCYDEELKSFLKKHRKEVNFVQLAFADYIDSIHDEYESMCEHEYIKDMCEANEYEFRENGEVY